MSQGSLPFKYLGVPLSSHKLSVMQCDPLIRKVLEKIDCWASKLLSYVGRVQLIKSVLTGMQNYWSQIFLLPQKVIKMVQAACRSFLWTGKSGLTRRALVAWDRLCLPKYAGGLGLINMKVWNRAAICKLLWNLAQKKDKIWVRWVHGYYVKNNILTEMGVPNQSAWVIRKIIGARDYLHNVPGGNEWLTRPEFSIQKLYKAMMGEVQKVEWSKMLYHNHAPPKCVFICWLVLQNGLVTCDKLQRVGITVDQSCCFCGSDVENVDHLFFGCRVIGRIWQEITEWIGARRDPGMWRDEKTFMISQCKTRTGKQCLYRSMLSVVIYEVWKERNSRRMKGIINDIAVVMHRCKLLIVWCCRKDPKLVNWIPNRW